jgi:hypothetical protein
LRDSKKFVRLEIVLDQSYVDEVAETAVMIVQTIAHIHLMMKGDFNGDPNQPSSSFNEHNWYFTLVDGTKESTHNANLQYGDPLKAQQDPDLSSWNGTETLEKIDSGNWIFAPGSRFKNGGIHAYLRCRGSHHSSI